MKQQTRRIRPLLLVLLWIWVASIALVLDLFLNVTEFDAIRPRSTLYQGMRIAAHAMVGEPLLLEETAPPRAREVATRASPLPRGSRHPDGRPDATTPQGRKLLDGLAATAAGAEDPARRMAAVRGLASMFGEAAAGTLSGIATDTQQPEAVRNLALRLLEES